MKRPVLATVLLISTALALSGCSVLFGPERAPRDASGAITAPADAAAMTIRIGDCMNEPADGEIESVPVVPCTEPHEFEIFHEFNLQVEDFPQTDDAMDALVLPACDAAFASFVGRGVEDSRLDYFTLTPTPESWSENKDRTIQCAIGDPENVKTTGSLRGSNL